MTEGIVCLISAVEPCMPFQVRRRHETKTTELFRRERKLHRYLYLIDPEYGFMHVRMQGWIPYECQIYRNGREWLARALDKAKIGYVRYENSLLAVDDIEAAAKLCDRFAHRAWPRVLNAFARMLNPLLPAMRTVEPRPSPVGVQAEKASGLRNAVDRAVRGGTSSASSLPHHARREMTGVVIGTDERRGPWGAPRCRSSSGPDSSKGVQSCPRLQLSLSSSVLTA